MATLQQHKEAMVDLLANGSGIPASASRLAHALHDVLALLEERRSEPHRAPVGCRVSENIGGEIHDVKLAADVDECSSSGHMWASLQNAHTVECMRCGVDKKDVTVTALIDNLHAELANVTRQRDELKAMYDDMCEKWLSINGEHGALSDACISYGLEPTDMIEKEQAK